MDDCGGVVERARDVQAIRIRITERVCNREMIVGRSMVVN